jgi:TRAP-type uncharacterized transport system fused permease subunit
MSDKKVLEQSLDELIENMAGGAVAMSYVEQKKTQALRLIVKDLIKSINNNAQSADRLATVLIVLEVIIGIVTAIGVYFQLFH